MADDGLVDQLAQDFRAAVLPERQRAMLDYADKLTRTPWKMVADDVAALRRAGLSDAEILDVAQVTGYYAFVNRLADGLGVELEPFWSSGSPD